MFQIIYSNVGLWFNLLIPIAIGAYLLLNHKDYVLKEFFAQMGLTLVFLLLMFLLLFSTTTDLLDKEYWNGKVSSFSYFEKWTEEETYTEEECSGSGKNRSCHSVSKTRRIYHSPYWEILTSNNEIISISKSNFRRAYSDFGKTFKSLHHFGQVSFGDGNKYISYPTKVIPTAVSHTYTNYVVAAKKNVINEQVSEQEFAPYLKNKSLREYPSSYRSTYGETKLNRIVDTTGLFNRVASVPILDAISAQFGRLKQVNPIIYVTDQGRDFSRVLKGYWNGAKKNDVVLILGIDKSSRQVVWSDVITYTDNTDFIVDMQNKFAGLNVSDPKLLLNTFSGLIATSYKRKPMEDFSYLKENITLEWYWQFLVFLLNVMLSGFLFLKFLEKDIPNPFKSFKKNKSRSSRYSY